MGSIKTREQVDVKETWDLTALFKTEEAYESALKELGTRADAFVEEYRGNLTSAETITKALLELQEILELSDHVGSYASLDWEADINNPKKVARMQNATKADAKVMAQLSFVESEILEQDIEVIREASKADERNRVYLERLLRNKPYQLEKETEKALAILSPTIQAPYQIYSDIKFGDVDFPAFEVDGKTYEMTYNTFENRMEHENDTAVRRKAFEVFSETIRKHVNGTAGAYNTHVQTEKTISDLRGYESVFDFLLQRQNVTRDMYNRQIDTIMSRLAAPMQKYAKLLKKIHKLDKLTYADLKIEVDPSYAPHVTFEEAEAYVLDGLSVLGPEYGKILKDAFENRWIDYAENKGKRTGAFCSSPYGAHSYVLMSFNEAMNEVMTLAHELGHAGHFNMAGKNQSLFNTRCSMYFVEAPSTTNEIIIENYLLKKAGDDKRMRRWVLSQMISKTYYHNFVTHLLEAAYQREVYKIVDEGGSVVPEKLNELFRETLQKFWGDAVELTEGAELTWMRQPHYYMGLYPYTYSAGLTIGTQMAKRILEEGDHVAKEWVEVLKMGGTRDSIGLAKAAGVDITTDQPLNDTIDYIASLVDELETLTEELEAEEK